MAKPNIETNSYLNFNSSHASDPCQNRIIARKSSCKRAQSDRITSDIRSGALSTATPQQKPKKLPLDSSSRIDVLLICDMCGENFTNQTNFKRHEASHIFGADYDTELSKYEIVSQPKEAKKRKKKQKEIICGSDRKKTFKGCSRMKQSVKNDFAILNNEVKCKNQSEKSQYSPVKLRSKTGHIRALTNLKLMEFIEKNTSKTQKQSAKIHLGSAKSKKEKTKQCLSTVDESSCEDQNKPAENTGMTGVSLQGSTTIAASKTSLSKKNYRRSTADGPSDDQTNVASPGNVSVRKMPSQRSIKGNEPKMVQYFSTAEDSSDDQPPMSAAENVETTSTSIIECITDSASIMTKQKQHHYSATNESYQGQAKVYAPDITGFSKASLQEFTTVEANLKMKQHRSIIEQSGKIEQSDVLLPGVVAKAASKMKYLQKSNVSAKRSSSDTSSDFETALNYDALRNFHKKMQQFQKKKKILSKEIAFMKTAEPHEVDFSPPDEMPVANSSIIGKITPNLKKRLRTSTAENTVASKNRKLSRNNQRMKMPKTSKKSKKSEEKVGIFESIAKHVSELAANKPTTGCLEARNASKRRNKQGPSTSLSSNKISAVMRACEVKVALSQSDKSFSNDKSGQFIPKHVPGDSNGSHLVKIRHNLSNDHENAAHGASSVTDDERNNDSSFGKKRKVSELIENTAPGYSSSVPRHHAIPTLCTLPSWGSQKCSSEDPLVRDAPSICKPRTCSVHTFDTVTEKEIVQQKIFQSPHYRLQESQENSSETNGNTVKPKPDKFIDEISKIATTSGSCDTVCNQSSRFATKPIDSGPFIESFPLSTPNTCEMIPWVFAEHDTDSRTHHNSHGVMRNENMTRQADAIQPVEIMECGTTGERRKSLQITHAKERDDLDDPQDDLSQRQVNPMNHDDVVRLPVQSQCIDEVEAYTGKIDVDTLVTGLPVGVEHTVSTTTAYDCLYKPWNMQVSYHHPVIESAENAAEKYADASRSLLKISKNVIPQLVEEADCNCVQSPLSMTDSASGAAKFCTNAESEYAHDDDDFQPSSRYDTESDRAGKHHADNSDRDLATCCDDDVSLSGALRRRTNQNRYHLSTDGTGSDGTPKLCTDTSETGEDVGHDRNSYQISSDNCESDIATEHANTVENKISANRSKSQSKSKDNDNDVKKDLTYWIKEDKEFTRRAMEERQKPRPYQCQRCKRTFTTLENRLVHYLVHLGGKVYPCKTCGRSFMTGKSLKEHRYVHKIEENLRLLSKDDSESVKPATKKIPKTFKCSICHEKLFSKALYMLHTKAPKAGFSCKICNKVFPCKGLLCQHHVQTHKNVTSDIVCLKCEQKFSDAAYLKNHEKLHSSCNKYICIVCGIFFNLKLPLKNHILVSHGLICDICGLSFLRRDELRNHLKFHRFESEMKTEVAPKSETTESASDNKESKQEKTASGENLSSVGVEYEVGGNVTKKSESANRKIAMQEIIEDIESYHEAKSNDQRKTSLSEKRVTQTNSVDTTLNEQWSQTVSESQLAKEDGGILEDYKTITNSNCCDVKLGANKRSYNCKRCAASYSRCESLHSHMDIQHADSTDSSDKEDWKPSGDASQGSSDEYSDIEPSRRKHKCRICGRVFFNNSSLLRHMHVQHRDQTLL